MGSAKSFKVYATVVTVSAKAVSEKTIKQKQKGSKSHKGGIRDVLFYVSGYRGHIRGQGWGKYSLFTYFLFSFVMGKSMGENKNFKVG